MRGIFCNFFFLSTRDLFSENHSGKETFLRALFYWHEDLPVRDKQHQQLYVTVSLNSKRPVQHPRIFGLKISLDI